MLRVFVLVPGVGLEPTRLSAESFKPSVFANFTTRARSQSIDFEGNFRKSVIFVKKFPGSAEGGYLVVILRRGRESNSRIRVLQTLGLPLAYRAIFIKPYFFFKISFCWCVLKNLSCLMASLLDSHDSKPNSFHGLYAFVDFTLPALCKVTRFSTFFVDPTYKSLFCKLCKKYTK